MFFFFLFVIIRSKKYFPCYVVTLGLYFTSGIGCVIFYMIQDYKSPIIPDAILFHIIMLFLLIIPIKYYDRFAYEKIELIPEKILKPFVYIIIVSSIYSIYKSFDRIDFNRILTDVVNIRNEIGEEKITESGIIGYIVYYARIFWSLALVLMFYYIIYFPKKKIIIFLLFISSLSQVIESFTIAGRDIVLKYIFIFFILILLFRFELPQKTKRYIYKLLIIIGIFFISFFSLISILRWDMNDYAETSTIEGLISYLGQPFLYFSEYFEHFSSTGATGGNIHFPLFSFSENTVNRLNTGEYIQVNMKLNTFSTSIGSWIFEVGALAASLITVIHHFLMIGLKRKKKTIFTIIYVIWVFEFIFFSLFYYIYTINLSFLGSIFIVKILEIIYFLLKNK